MGENPGMAELRIVLAVDGSGASLEARDLVAALPWPAGTRRLSAVGVATEAVVRSGDAAQEIVQAAAERGADLIVTGSRRRRGIDRLFLGSVARNVLQHAGVSVLIVRPALSTGPR